MNVNYTKLTRPERQEKIKQINYASNLPMTNSEKIKLEIFTSLSEDLEDSINNNSESSQSLSLKIFYLNIILTIATVVGTIIAIAKFFNCNT